MDITSPISLWKDYDVATLPLNSYALSQKTENGAVVKEFYFDGYTTVDGRVRTYIKIYEHADSKGVLLFMPDSDYELSANIRDKMYELGYTIAELDYLGRTEKRARYTFYPQSLNSCNSDGIKQFDITDDEKYSRWYIWICLARRATLFLKELYEQKLYALGVGLGGNTVYKLTAFDDGISACATLLNILPNVRGEGNAIINYHASLDNYAYASISKIKLFMAIASNDEDGSLDKMSELAADTQSLCRFRIVERGFHYGIINMCPDLDKFFSEELSGGELNVRPEITASNSDGNLYFNITINDPDGNPVLSDNGYKLDLYVSFCVTSAPYRNWMKMYTISLGENKYMAQINVCRSDKPIFAFANVSDNNGITQSSALLCVLPKSLGVRARPGIIHRKIYDGSMEKDCWTAQDGGNIRLVKGPYGIDGVTSDTNNIVTFKPGDPLYKVPSDTLLQVMAAGGPQTLCVRVSDGENIYSCNVEISGLEDWHKFSLAHNNFKSDNGALSDWTNILTLEFTSDKQFIIGSVLWI